MNRPASLLATVFRIGYAPAPGTVASLAALPLGWWLTFLGGWSALLIATVIVTMAGIWACGVHARSVGIGDPSECVIDEVAGQWLALLPLGLFTQATFDWRFVLAAFVLFRVFDILKPWPISRLEHLHGGVGIMADDIAAGLVAAALGAIALYEGWL